MGRGRGMAEPAPEEGKVVLDRTRRDVDSDDEEESGIMPEKAIEQIKQEEEQNWRRYEYPAWVHKLVYVIFILCLSNMILTLTHYHGTHSWRRPADLLPLNLLPGGWGDDARRYGGAVLGLIASCFSFVFAPGQAKFKFMFFIAFISGLCHSFAFGEDLDQLNKALDLEICKDNVPDMQVRKFGCQFARFRATVIFDVLAAVFMFATSFFLLYQATTGVVTKRKVFNEQTKAWEKIVLGQNDEYWVAYPPIFKKQRPCFNLVMVLAAVINIVVLVLTVTQSTLDIYQATHQTEPIYNTNRRLPVDIYIYEGQEGIPFGLGNGSWPKQNFLIRFWANAISLTVLAFLIQWRRDGRQMQLVVQLVGLVGAVLYMVGFIYDTQEFLSTQDQYCTWARANNMKCYLLPYEALVVIDGFCCVLMGAFSFHSLIAWLFQAMRPINHYHGAPAGWYFFGGGESEWAHEQRNQ